MSAVYYLLHPNQLRSIIQWKLWHEPVHKRDPSSECDTLRSCFTYLDLTSRSFVAVIKELNPELLVPITLFYLVLRGLDTIEDDMTIDIKIKEPLLREFYENMKKDGWTFSGNHTKEKDRELLVHFDVVVTELKKIKEQYYVVIEDICKRMGNGMADYALNAEFNANGIESIKDYEKYCHYVAGLVGEGLTRLFLESGHVNPKLRDRPELSESMGQFLQQTNIIRDVHEDWLDGRRFWPREVWSKHVDKWEDLFVPENREKAMHVSSELVLNALRNAEQCLFYMAAVREQSVFNFVAIPQSMAIATLDLVFRNPEIFEKHVKISKGDACQLMIESTQNLRVVCDAFRRYTRRIHKKNDPRDPNYLAISIQCGRIEQFIETLFPSQTPPKDSKAIGQRINKEGMDGKEVVIMVLMVFFILFTLSALMLGTALLLGARFDKILSEKSVYWPSNPSNPTFSAKPPVHSEL